MDVDSIVLHFCFCLSSHRQIGPARMGGLIKSVGSSQRQIQSGLDGRIDGQTSGCRERLSVNRWPHWNSLMPLEFIDGVNTFAYDLLPWSIPLRLS